MWKITVFLVFFCKSQSHSKPRRVWKILYGRVVTKTVIVTGKFFKEIDSTIIEKKLDFDFSQKSRFLMLARNKLVL